MPIDFVILDMAENAHVQIILGKPFLATMGYKIDVRKGRLTFDVGEKRVEYGLFKDFKSAPLATYSYCGCNVIDLIKPDHFG